MAEIVGQEDAINALATRLLQFLDTFEHRKQYPVMVNLAGLYGLGKTSLTDLLRQMGLGFMAVDAQKYLGSGSLQSDIRNWNRDESPDAPRILVIDEIDKILAPQSSDADAKKSGAFLGELNELTGSGRIGTLDLKNVFVVFCMNLSPSVASEWLSKEKSDKTFWELSLEEVQRLHTWMTSAQGKHAVLEKSFPAHLVTRLAPVTVFLKPLGSAEHREILDRKLKHAVEQTQEVPAQRISARYSDRFQQFLYKVAVQGATGARTTAMITEGIVEQLIAIGKYAIVQDQDTFCPRELFFDLPEGKIDPESPNSVIQIRITAVRGTGRKTHVAEPVFLSVEYSSQNESVIIPEGLVYSTAKVSKPGPPPERVTRASVKSWRDVRNFYTPGDVFEQASQQVFGQVEVLKALERDLNFYSSLQPDPQGTSYKRVIAGFRGNGKSSAVVKSLEAAGIPYIKLNMQAFANNAEGFAQVLYERVRNAGRPFAVVLEEVDKIPELVLRNGVREVITPTPEIIGMFKQLMDTKRLVFQTGEGDADIDLTDVYLVATMNFGGEGFGFRDDPRLTSFGDIHKVWKSLQAPETLNQQLKTLFLPDFVDRVIPYLIVSDPLVPKDHILIQRAARDYVGGQVLGGPGRNYDDNGARVRLRFSNGYSDYLWRESVVPSKGGRHTREVTQRILERDFARALESLPRSVRDSKDAITLSFGFSSRRSSVSCRYRNETEGGSFKLLFDTQTPQSFPDLLVASGRLPANRILTAVHEFGHALVGVLFNHRFDHILAVTLCKEMAGRVKSPSADGGESGVSKAGSILFSLGGRAMERALLGRPEEATVRSTGDGGFGDLQDATAELYSYLYELGQAPQAGVGSRAGRNKSPDAKRSADVQHGAITAAEGQALQKILRRLEDYLETLIRENFDREWLTERITALARAGLMKEREFYELIGLAYPEPSSSHFLGFPELTTLFSEVIIPEPSSAQNARHTFMGNTQTTPAQFQAQAIEVLDSAVNKFYVPTCQAALLAAGQVETPAGQ